MKYITFRVDLSDGEMAIEAFIAFHEHLTHSEVFAAIKNSVGEQCGSSGEKVTALGAGFVYYNRGLPSCVGCSDSMNLKNRGELDDEILRRDTQANFIEAPRDILHAINDTLYNALWNLGSGVKKIREQPVYVVFCPQTSCNLIEENPNHRLEIGDPVSYIGPTVGRQGFGAHIVRFDETEFAMVDDEFFRNYCFPYDNFDRIIELRENAWTIEPNAGEFYGLTSKRLVLKYIRLKDGTAWGINPMVEACFEDEDETHFNAEDTLENMLENMHKHMLDGFLP